MIHRRTLLQLGAVVAMGQVGWAWSAGAVLPAPQSLKEELAKALAKGNPLVIMVSLERCPFCKVARDSYLEPLRRQEGIPIFQVDMRTNHAIRHFDDSSKTHDDLAREWGIKIAPTVLFFGANGKEAAERLVGGYLPDFYGSYLEQRMESARAAIKKGV